MEKFKPATVEVKGMSKLIKLLTLVIGIGAAGNSFAQENITKNIEQLIKDAKNIELVLSEQVKNNGKLGTSNNLPMAQISSESKISKIVYSDNERINPSSVLVGYGNIYFWDRNADGALDGVYMDRHEKIKDIEEGAMKSVIALEGEITQTELDLSEDIDEKFICYKLDENKVYDTSDSSISDVSKEDLVKLKVSLQEKFNKVLQSNLESIK